MALITRAPFDVLATAQVIRDQVVNAPPGLTRPRADTLLTVYLRRAFRNESFLTELRFYGGVEDSDRLVRFSVTYSLPRFGELQLGADVFGGEPSGIFGQYRDRRRAFLEWRFTL